MTPFQERDANKERRFRDFERQLTQIAQSHKVTPRSLARIFYGQEWREIYNWKEAPEFIERIAVGEA